MSRIPTTPEEEQELIEIARGSLGRVLDVREWFSKYFDTVNRPVLDLSSFPADFQDTFRRIRSDDCRMYVLSDAIVISFALSDEYEHCRALNGFETALFAISGMAVSAFAAGVSLRGGMDVGIATSIDDKEVYGPAMVRAYTLESEVAEYPRFVAGTELIRFLERVRDQKPQTRFGQAAQRLAAQCRRIIVQDTDGRQMVDFLNKEVKDTLALQCEMFSKGHSFVRGEYEKFDKGGNEKLASRYYRLLQYYLARKKMWGL